MDYTKEEDVTIFYLKFIQALFCQNSVVPFLREAEDLGIEVCSPAILELVCDLVAAYTDGCSFPHAIDFNIREYMNYCRFEKCPKIQDSKKEIFELCNEIIILLNNSQGKEEYPFYENLIRYLYHNPIRRKVEQIGYRMDNKAVAELLQMYFTMEYYILYSHTNLLEDEDFTPLACNFLLSDVYLQCVLFLLEEYPHLKEDEIFVDRVKNILRGNQELKQVYEGTLNESDEFELEKGDAPYLQEKSLWRLQKKINRKIS